MKEITPDIVLSALSGRHGRDMGLSVRELVARLRAGPMFVQPHDERDVRASIETLRRRGLHICGTPTDGYYMARTEEELLETCEFLYRRAMTSLSQVAAMRQISLPDLRGQFRLKT